MISRRLTIRLIGSLLRSFSVFNPYFGLYLLHLFILGSSNIHFFINTIMKTTSLTPAHIDLGAKMSEFAGYNMPISYSGIKEEHMAVREHCGIFDVSHMGEFLVKGKEALELVQKVTSNDASKLEIGQAQYSCMPNLVGGIVDDLLVYRLDEDKCADGEKAFMLVVNASNIDKDWNWIKQNNSFDCKMTNISDSAGLLAIQGPKATELLQNLTKSNLSEIEYYHFTKGSVAGIENVIISATGYTGSGGFELYVDNQYLKTLWDAILAIGEPYGLQPAGLGARDTLRLEKGFCLYGNDINDETSPIEAGLGWITKLKQDFDFNSKQLFIQQKEAGVEKRLVAFKVSDRRVPRQGYKIFSEDGETEIGEVTSGTQSPCLDCPIGMGYVKLGHHKSGSTIHFQAGKKLMKAEIVKLPFV